MYRGSKARRERLEAAVDAALNRTYKHLEQQQADWATAIQDIKLNSKAEAMQILQREGLLVRMAGLDRMENEQVMLSEGRRVLGAGPSPMLCLCRAELAGKQAQLARLRVVLDSLQ
jgi:hypothetical protein